MTGRPVDHVVELHADGRGYHSPMKGIEQPRNRHTIQHGYRVRSAAVTGGPSVLWQWPRQQSEQELVAQVPTQDGKQVVAEQRPCDNNRVHPDVVDIRVVN